MLKLLLVLCAICLYVKGECDTKWLGKSNKNWKLTLGLPLFLLPLFGGHFWFALMTILTYLIAGSFGYGESNWLTKLMGPQNAIIFCGGILGLASFGIIGFWSILAMIISGWAWYGIHIYDDKGIIKEPYVAILRALGGTICLLF